MVDTCTRSIVLLFIYLQHMIADGGRILYLPFPQLSQFIRLTCMTEELKAYQHELWMAVPPHLSKHSSLSHKNIHLIQIGNFGSTNFDEALITLLANETLSPSPAQSGTIWHRLTLYFTGLIINRKIPSTLFDTIRDMNHKVLTDRVFLNTIKEKKFDLIIVDGGVGIINSIIPYRLDVPFCYIANMHLPWQSGTPTLPSFIPLGSIGATDKMSFLQRFVSVVQHLWMLRGPAYAFDHDIVRYAPEKPAITIQNLMGKAKLWFVVQDEVADYPRSIMPNTKMIGGLCSKDAEPLSSHFKDFYSRSKHGVVVVSFGGSVKTIPKQLSRKLLLAFNSTKYDFIWRSDSVFNDSKFLITDWLPQNDLLGHPKTKLFITHGGANGQYEAIYHGVPMLAVPIFADQPYNTMRMVSKGFGLGLDIYKNSAKDFAIAINRIIETPSFKHNIMKASAIFKGRPLTSRQEAAYWMDYVIKHGDSFIRSRGLDLRWFEYLCLDVIVVMVLCLVTLLTMCIGMTLAVYRYIGYVIRIKYKQE